MAGWDQGIFGNCMALVLAGCSLSGCSLRLDVPPQSAPSIVNIHPGQTIETPGPAEVIDTPDPPKCFARARFFRGLVQTDCAAIAREVRP